MTAPHLSVVIPTYRRVDDVLRCVESLLVQDLRDIEILVVDNSPDGDLRAQLNRLGKAVPTGAPPIRYVPEPRLGVHHARHAGAKAAASDLLLYIDDDAVADPGWARAYAEAFEADPELAAASGPVRPEWAEEPQPWLLQLATTPPMFGPFALIRREAIDLEPRGVLFSVNMAIRRGVLFEAKGFHPEAFGQIWLGDGETGLNRKLWRTGARIAWVEEASVTHRIPRERMRLDYLRTWGGKQGAADAYTAYHPRIPSRVKLASDAGLHALRTVVQEVRRTRAADRGRAAWCALWASYSRARTRYALRLTYSRRLRQLVERENWVDD